MDLDRSRVLAELEAHLAAPMAALGVLWLALMGHEIAAGPSLPVRVAIAGIWVVFLADFLIRLALAPDRRRWLRGEWIVALSLAVPPFRVVGLARLVPLLRLAPHGVTLVRVVAAFNDGAAALRRALHRKRAGYAVALTVLVVLAGAAGMYAFERDAPGSPLGSYAEAVWWTAMLVTTIGSQYWPQTPGGQALCLLLSIYAVGVIGYVTGAVASLFLEERR